ncbi:DUF6701 domain-containing protein [Marinobacter fonticola]|uniref:DUF6701 domain-containing protein n=1 Tax=Marinobacter fonticola TaxID=2603215 RepID=UPI0011E7BFA6|nr:DUF6701 domain-containing protein [Marinobacter fonticola]
MSYRLRQVLGLNISCFRLLALMLVFCATPVAAQSNEAVAEWRMDERQWTGAAGEVADSTGNGHSGRARTAGGANSLPSTVDAKVCRGGRFRGQGFNDPSRNGAYVDAQHFVEVADANALSPLSGSGGRMSVSGWFQMDSTNDTQTLLHKGVGSQSQEYNLWVTDRDLEVTFWNRFGSPYSLRLTNSNVQADRWYFFWIQAARYDNGTLGMQVTMFDNNVELVESQVRYIEQFFSGQGGNYNTKPLNGPLLFGGTRYGTGNPVNFFDGMLDEVRFHDRLFGFEDIQEMANTTRDCASSSLQCFNDDYSQSNLSEDWVTSVSVGNFTPQVTNGRLRMTQARSNQATAATLQREIPGAENLVVLEFDYYAYGGNGADGLAFVLSDANVTPRPGSYGGSLGYAQRSNGDPGFAGGWIGIGLDEFGNFSNATEGRVGGPGFRRDAIAIRGAAPNYRYLRGTQTLNPGVDTPNTNNPSPQRYRITVDSRRSGEALVSVERDTTGTGNSYQQLVAPFNALNEPGQPAVPENFLLSMTGSTGGSNNIHEFDNFQLCALKLNPVGAQVDHFRIYHDGTALTCQPEEEILVRACADPNCNALFTDPVQATMAPSGWVGGDTINLTDGEASVALQRTTPGTVTLGVTGSEPSTRPQSKTLCQSGGGALSANNCKLTFFESGLVYDIPDLVSNAAKDGIKIRALKSGGDPGNPDDACVPAFENVTRNVAFWSTYAKPNASEVAALSQMTLNGTTVSNNASSPTRIPLAFDAQGVAEVSANYVDAGRLQLDARYTGSAETGDEGLEIPGADQFTTVPHGFCVQPTSLSAVCAAGDSTCDVFAAAGDVFQMRVKAVRKEGDGIDNLCVNNAKTPNFQIEALQLGHQLVAPSDGFAGSIQAGALSFTKSHAGERVFNQSVSEVGVFRFGIPVQPYLGASLPSANSAPIGRFIPAAFQVEKSDGALNPGCGVGGFLYSGQPTDWLEVPTLTITARNTKNGITENYTKGGFQKLMASDVEVDFPASLTVATTNADGTPSNVTVGLAFDESAGALSVISDGVMSYTFADPDNLLTFTKNDNSRINPYTPHIKLPVTSIEDSDEVAASALPELAPEAAFDVRYGRLRMENVFGPETATELKMFSYVEQWQGGRFVTNQKDNCLAPNMSQLANTANHHNMQSTSAAVANGVLGPLLLKPTGRGTDTLSWDAPAWLEYDWDGDGSQDDPSATATFGVYRGHDRVIYWREL